VSRFRDKIQQRRCLRNDPLYDERDVKRQQQYHHFFVYLVFPLLPSTLFCSLAWPLIIVVSLRTFTFVVCLQKISCVSEK